jgi:hypothetical protein
MTAQDQLLERVARAICRASGASPDQPVYRNGNPESGLLYYKWQVYREEAHAALTACHAEGLAEALRDLLEDTQHRDHACGDTLENCPVLRARAILVKLDAEP